MNGLKGDRTASRSLKVQTCTIKENRDLKMRFVFSVISPKDTILLQADNAKDLKEWMAVIQNAIMGSLDGAPPNSTPLTPSHSSGSHQSHLGIGGTGSLRKDDLKGISDKQVVETERDWAALKLVPGNNVCADCGAADPEWVSLNLGILICMEFSGVHRSLGVHISKVRSTILDKIDKYLFDYLKAIGNKNSNEIWERDPKVKRPTSTSDRYVREMFVRAKYEMKSFLGERDAKKDKLNEMLWTGIHDDQPSIMLKALACGAEPNWANPDEDKRTALHEAVMYRNPVCVELLLQQTGVDAKCAEVRGWTPLHYAAYQDDYALVEVILLRGGSKLALEQDSEGFTPLQTAKNHNERPICEPLLIQAAEKARGKT